MTHTVASKSEKRANLPDKNKGCEKIKNSKDESKNDSRDGSMQKASTTSKTTQKACEKAKFQFHS